MNTIGRASGHVALEDKKLKVSFVNYLEAPAYFLSLSLSRLVEVQCAGVGLLNSQQNIGLEADTPKLDYLFLHGSIYGLGPSSLLIFGVPFASPLHHRA